MRKAEGDDRREGREGIRKLTWPCLAGRGEEKPYLVSGMLMEGPIGPVREAPPM